MGSTIAVNPISRIAVTLVPAPRTRKIMQASSTRMLNRAGTDVKRHAEGQLRVIADELSLAATKGAPAVGEGACASATAKKPKNPTIDSNPLTPSAL